MTSSDVPPSVFRELTAALRDNVDAIRSTDRSLKSARSGLGNMFNPIQELGNAFRRSEQLQLRSLAAGTTYGKFLQSNTESMQGLMSSQQTMTKFLLTGFTQGLRNVSDETMALADEMNITGQDTDRLATVMGSVRLITGNSIDVTAKLATTIQKTSRDNGITSEQLITALDSMRQALTNVSIFGEQAVGAFADLGTELTGRLQGVQGSQQAINTLLNTLSDPLNVATQELLGLRGLSEDLISGRISQSEALSELADAAQAQMDMFAGEDPKFIQSLRNVIGPEVTNALSIVGKGLQRFEGLSEAQRKTQQENLQSMKKFEEAKMEFFGTLAPEIHAAITQKLPQILLFNAGSQALGAMGRLGATALATRGRTQRQLIDSAMSRGATRAVAGRYASRIGARAGMAAASRVAGRVLSFLGPVGLVAGTVVTFMPEIISLLGGIKDNGDAPAEAAKRANRASTINNIPDQLKGVGELARSIIGITGTSGSGSKLIEVLDKLTVTQQALADKIANIPQQTQQSSKDPAVGGGG